jgi:hypothetical protein
MINAIITPLGVNLIYPDFKSKKENLIGKKVLSREDFNGIAIVKELHGADYNYCTVEAYKKDGQPSRVSAYFNKLYIYPDTQALIEIALGYYEEQTTEAKEMLEWAKLHKGKFDFLEFKADGILQILDKEDDFAKAKEILLKYLKKT